MGPSHARTSESDTPEQFFAPGLEMLSGDEASRSSPSFRSCSIGSAGSLSDNGGGGGRSEALVAFGGVQAWESVCATEYPSFARARLTASYCPSSRSTAASACRAPPIGTTTVCDRHASPFRASGTHRCTVSSSDTATASTSRRRKTPGARRRSRVPPTSGTLTWRSPSMRRRVCPLPSIGKIATAAVP